MFILTTVVYLNANGLEAAVDMHRMFINLFLYGVSQKKSPLRFSDIFSQTDGNF